MPRGPEHQRLATYVDNADPDSLDEAATQWRTGMELLRQVSKELDTKANGMRAAQSYSDGEIWSGETAATARDAFTMSSVAMHDKSNEMEKGANAFTDAATGIRNARQRLQQLDNRDPGALPTAPTISPGPRSHADEVAQSNYDTGVANWWKDYNANETDATAAITTLQGNHHEQAVVFQSIHGETVDKPGAAGGGGNPVSTGTRPTVSHVPTTLVNDHDLNNPTDPDHDPNDPGDGSDNDPGGGGNTGPGDGSTDPGDGIDTGPGTDTGLPAGPTATSPIGPLTTGPTTTAGGGIGAVGGVGAVAGGAIGGAVAAGLAGSLSGGLNGLVPAGGGRGGLSTNGVRGIGATSRGTGVGSVLGRGTGTGGRAGAGGVASRNGGRGGSRGAAGRGTRGSAGARGAGTGAGAVAGRGGKDKKRSAEDRDLFDDGQDWLDDEAQPGLID